MKLGFKIFQLLIAISIVGCGSGQKKNQSEQGADLSDVKHVDIDAEKNLDLVRRLDIRSTPTTLVLDKSGHEVGRAVGAPKRAEVLATLSAIK